MTTEGLQRVAALHHPPLSLAEALVVAERFWAKVVRADGDGCWTYTGKPMKSGHCRAGIGRRQAMLAHRLAYVLLVGPLSAAECALHRCDNPPCIRPEHLFSGTQGDNVRDMASKGRQHVQRNPAAQPVCPPELKARGERSGRSRLTAAQVLDIRERVAGGAKRSALAAEYHATISHITAIATGRLWAHVGGPRLEV
jgi:hypothetical protein